MTPTTITQIIELLQSANSENHKRGFDLTSAIPANQQEDAIIQLRQLCVHADKNRDAEALLRYARAFFKVAQLSNNYSMVAQAYMFAATAKNYQKDYKESIKQLTKANNIALDHDQSLLSHVNYLYSLTYYHAHEYTQARQHANSALALYQQQHNQAGVENTRTLIQQIDEEQSLGMPQASSDELRTELTQLVVELRAAQEELNHIRAHIAQHTHTRDALLHEIETTQRHHNEQREQFAQAYAIAQQQHNEALAQLDQQYQNLMYQRQQAIQHLEHDITQITQQREDQQRLYTEQLMQFNHDIESRKATISDYDSQIMHLRERTRVWQMVEHMPFWLAIIKHEMAQQRISAESLEFLQKLYTLAPQEALATLVEVEARSDKAPNHTYNLDALHGEVRLFAATANARKLQETDTLAAVSHMVDAWEFFLKETT